MVREVVWVGEEAREKPACARKLHRAVLARGALVEVLVKDASSLAPAGAVAHEGNVPVPTDPVSCRVIVNKHSAGK